MKDIYDFQRIAKQMTAIIYAAELPPACVPKVFEAVTKELEENSSSANKEFDAKEAFQYLQFEIKDMKSSLNTIMHTLCNDIDTAVESKRMTRKWGIILAAMLAVNWITIVLCR